jgi:hypothetical protein
MVTKSYRAVTNGNKTVTKVTKEKHYGGIDIIEKIWYNGRLGLWGPGQVFALFQEKFL